jgi:hypothetical protein
MAADERHDGVVARGRRPQWADEDLHDRDHRDDRRVAAAADQDVDHVPCDG